MTGYTGLLSLGHAAFIGVGANTVAVLQKPLRHAILDYRSNSRHRCSCRRGPIFGLPSLRIRGLYLVIATLAAQFILYFIFDELEFLVTNGYMGVAVAPAVVFGYSITDLR